MVLRYAVPLAVSSETVTTSRAQLSQDLPLMIALCFANIGLYGVAYFRLRLVDHGNFITSR
jgi:malonate transporter and related proteins